MADSTAPPPAIQQKDDKTKGGGNLWTSLKNRPALILVFFVGFGVCAIAGMLAVAFSGKTAAKQDQENAKLLLFSVTAVRNYGVMNDPSSCSAQTEEDVSKRRTIPPNPRNCTQRPAVSIPSDSQHLPCPEYRSLRPLQSFSVALERTLFPLLDVKNFVESAPGGAYHSSVQAYFAKTKQGLLDLSPAIDDLQIAPFGTVGVIYPLVTKRRNATSVLQAGGHDLFNASSPVANRRDAAVFALVRSHELGIYISTSAQTRLR